MLLSLLMLFSSIGYINPFQKNRNGHNSLSETSTSLPFDPLLIHKYQEPYFDTLVPTNVTALVGKSAYLSCRVRNLGNKTVSWIRHRDLHILTVATYTYTTDQRFQTTYHRNINEWTLQIKWAQKRDGGAYECQVSTQPIKSYSVWLNVVDESQFYDTDDSEYGHDLFNDRPYYPFNDPSGSRLYGQLMPKGFAASHNGVGVWVPAAQVLGGPDMYVDKSSTINLTCVIRLSPEPPAFIFWYHEDQVINYDSTRGGISVMTEKGDTTTSYLLIQSADLRDSGKYSCKPSNVDIASIRVHVLNGERPEAMQTGGATTLVRRNSLGSVILCGFLGRLVLQLQTWRQHR